MSTPVSLEQGFKEYATYLRGVLPKLGIDHIRDTTEKISKDAEEFYGTFFQELYSTLSGGGQGVTTTPSRFLRNMGGEGRWKPLSEAWSDRKIISGDGEFFYIGLSGALNRARTKAWKARNTPKGRPRNRAPFMDFLQKMGGKSPGLTKKFFGPLSVNYSIDAKGRKTPIKIRQENGVIREILGRITSHDARGQMIPNLGNVALVSEISMFPLLKQVQTFSEWYVVDHMARIDPSNRPQWRKINSQYGIRGSIRPIRAAITPLISWYATTGFEQVLRKHYIA